MPLPNSIRVRQVAGIAVLAVFGLTGTAWAGSTPLGSLQMLETGQSQSTCDNPLIVHPFSSFGDDRDYVLAPGGEFEDGVAEGWQFSSGAKLAQGGRNSAGSLALPPGASAVSPSMCVDLNYPTFRFYGKATGEADDAEIMVEVVYPHVANPAFEEIKKFDAKQGTEAGDGWRLSDDIDLKPDLGGSLAGRRQVALRFTSVGETSGGDYRVDDVYIDPKRL